MATAESVKNKLQGLIDTANETTGETAADLTTAVATLVAGFGKGSDEEGGTKGFYKSLNLTSGAAGTRINLDFGFVPDFILMACQGKVSSTYTYLRFGFGSAVEKLGVSARQIAVYLSSSSITRDYYIEPFDGVNNRYIYAVDETGFTIGLRNHATGYQDIYAFKFA